MENMILFVFCFRWRPSHLLHDNLHGATFIAGAIRRWHRMYDIYLTQTPSSCSPSSALTRAPWVMIGGIALQRVWGGISLPVKELRLRVGWSGSPIYKAITKIKMQGFEIVTHFISNSKYYKQRPLERLYRLSLYINNVYNIVFFYNHCKS